uniref:Uncharacterized protein n=1 Tax=Plectus sambesii TaxID=2011161 RepID=A0A914XL76_9BILA
MAVSAIIFVCLFSSVVSLQCYTGFVPWGGAADDNSSVTLENCQQNEGCCQSVISLPGRTFKCASDCPQSDNYPQCDQEMDSSWCYCKDHEDSNCSPSEMDDPQAPENVIEGSGMTDSLEENNNDSSDNGTLNNGLQCYVGFRSWSDQVDNAVTLQNCSEEHSCCRTVRSLPGSTYSCSSECPSDWSKACRPTAEEGLMDVSWCFCKDHQDGNCSPSEMDDPQAPENDIEGSGTTESVEENNNDSSDNGTLNDGLQCYVGHQSWSDQVDNAITLQNCSEEHSCCHIVRSLPGSTYSCSSECPNDWSKACGPSPDERIMDVSWCFCKGHNDPSCTPIPSNNVEGNLDDPIQETTDTDSGLVRIIKTILRIVNSFFHQ